MVTHDMDVIKEVPGYKIILKAVLKTQIQQLVSNTILLPFLRCGFETAWYQNTKWSSLSSAIKNQMIEFDKQHNNLTRFQLFFLLRTTLLF